MRDLPYVSFLDEQRLIQNITQNEINAVQKTAWDNPSRPSGNTISFQEALENSGAIDGMGIDNHSHGLNIGSFQNSANADTSKLAIDAYVCSKLNDPSIELITNSRLQPYLENSQTIENQSLLTQLLILENIPNYLTPKGPYHPVIEEVRENRHLTEFRKWISQQRGLTSVQEVKEVKTEVENALQEAQEKLFLKHCDPKRHYSSIGKAMIGDVVGVLFPATGTVTAIAEAGIDAVNPEATRWQGFIVGTRRDVRSSIK